MQDNTVSARNIGCMIALMTLSSLLITGLGSVGQDMWLATIVAALIAVPLLLVYARISSLNRGLNLIDIVYKHFGSLWGCVLTLLLSWYALHVSALVTRNFTEFVSSISLEHTPKVFIIIGMIAAGGYLANTNFKVLGRWSLIVLLLVTINLVLTLLLSLSSIQISYLKPVMEHSVREIFSSSLSFGAVAFAETALALVAFGAMKSGDSPYKAYGIGIGFGAVLLVSVVMRNIMLLGREMISTAVFPSYITARIINPGTFIEHIESIVSFNLILLGITKVSICIRAASMGVAKLFRLEVTDRMVITPISLLSIAICVTSFQNMQELISFLSAYRLYASLFTVLIPLIIWLKSERN